MTNTKPVPESQRFLLDARDEASEYLGRELTDAEWTQAYPPMAKKLSGIIQRHGDDGGARCQPRYLGKLVQEYLTFSILSAYCAAMSAQKKTASEEDGLPTTTNITPEIINCQS